MNAAAPTLLRRSLAPLGALLLLALAAGVVAWPGFCGCGDPAMRRRRNENAAIATLRSIAGTTPLRGAIGTALADPLLPRSFGEVDEDGAVERAGYRFTLELRGADSAADAPAWRASARPVHAGETGGRAFRLDAGETMLEATVPPDPGAVLRWRPLER